MGRKSRAWIAGTGIILAGVMLTFTGPLSAKREPPQTRNLEAEIAAGKTMGSKSAPIMLEDFSDFQCPMCRQFYLDTTRKVIDDYVVTGKVYLVHHDFPLPMHAHSHDAAKWADAAAAIGRFQEVENALYTKQDDWGATGKVEEAVATVLSPAELKRVRALVDSPQVAAAIQHDEDMGHQRNVNSTPSVFITLKGGQAQPLPPAGTTFSLLKQYFDYVLKH